MKIYEEEYSESRYEREIQYQREESYSVPEFCREHPDETLGYFCFDCETECICAECVIHGEHKGHEVMQIKKAYPVIKDRIEDMNIYVNNKIDEIQLRGEKLESQKKEIIDQGNAAKQQVIVSFEDLRARMDKKEREIISQIERLVQQNLKEVENFTRIIIGKITALESIGEGIKRILNINSYNEVLDFYAENKEKMMNSIENEMSTLGNIDMNVNLRCAINTVSLAEHIESVKAVNIQISALRIIDDSGADEPKYSKKIGIRSS